MKLRFQAYATVLLILSLTVVTAAAAQGLRTQQIDCDVEANREKDVCLGLLPDAAAITNFAPVISPVVGGVAAAGLLSAGGRTISTTSTTSTTGTTN